MFYSPFRWLIRKGIEAVVGKVSDGLSGGDPMGPDYEFVKVEKQETDPLYPLRVIEAKLDKALFRETMSRFNERLERGMRAGHLTILNTKVEQLGVGEEYSVFCSVFHGGAPTGLRIVVIGRDSGVAHVHVEGRGPAVEQLLLELKEVGWVKCGGDKSE